MQRRYIPAWEAKDFLVACETQGRSWWEVAGGTWWGTQVGYTSFLRGASQKAGTSHFHVENRVEIDILGAAAELLTNLKKMSGWISIQADGIWNSGKSFGKFPTKFRNRIEFLSGRAKKSWKTESYEHSRNIVAF